MVVVVEIMDFDSEMDVVEPKIHTYGLIDRYIGYKRPRGTLREENTH